MYSKLEPLRDIDADIRTAAITICKWFGVKTYDVIILKINLALIGHSVTSILNSDIDMKLIVISIIPMPTAAGKYTVT